MPMAIFKGVLKELGPNVTEASETVASTVYTYIELADGQMIRNVSVVGGLGGKLDAALDHHDPIELHVMQGGKKSDLLIAVRASDGKIFATELGDSSTLSYALVISTAVLGLGLIPIFGIGLLFLWGAWRLWHGMKLVNDARKHVRALPDAILV